MPDEQLTLQIVPDDMTFGEWFRAIPEGLPDGSRYVIRDEDGTLRVLRGKELAARSLDERADAKAKRLKQIKRKARKRKRIPEGEFRPEAAGAFLRERLGITNSPLD
jgi:hypothetical protein